MKMEKYRLFMLVLIVIAILVSVFVFNPIIKSLMEYVK
jgi:hypothetical protein